METRITQTYTQILHFALTCDSGKYYHVTLVNDYEKPFRITCKNCHGCVNCSGKVEEILYITFINSGMTSITLYPEYNDPDNLFFQWNGRRKRQQIYQIFKKKEIAITST